MTEQEVQQFVHLDNVLIDEFKCYTLFTSPIHGIGVKVLKDIRNGEVLDEIFVDAYHRSLLGRFTNHSDTPNCKFVGVNCVACRDIKADEELLVDYGDHYGK